MDDLVATCAPFLRMKYPEFAAMVSRLQRALLAEQDRVDQLPDILDLNPEWAQHRDAELGDVLSASEG